MQYDSKKESKTLSHNYLSGDSSLVIDIIRVVACDMVVISHNFDISIVYFKIAANNSVPFIVIINDFFGHVGVILFFIVSGTVITNSLLKNIDINETYNFKNYFIDRFSRIYAGLVPSLILTFIFTAILLNTSYEYCVAMKCTSIDFFSWIGSLFMLQGIVFPNIQA
jgi:peptidoglycan/LPS O-acetylase OafA/YrhL